MATTDLEQWIKDNADAVADMLRKKPEDVKNSAGENVPVFFAQFAERYQKDPASAAKALRVGESPVRAGMAEPELAAYTLIANLLLNLDETVMRN